MTTLRGEDLYWEAFERLKVGKAHIVDTTSPKFKFNKDNVAIEAGKSKGFVKQERYPELCSAIQKAEKVRCSNADNTQHKSDYIRNIKSQKKKANARYSQLKKENELCLEKMMNLLRENFELRREVEELRRANSKLKLIE
ncbi:hypothetical protein [Vibrio cyclitrophicus]|uniref:hypothetical protein n=1 Tax=Vibrio cyclitrophicus TaxID=47951 RepID=UPI00148BECBA|nr:hypothetical protein [Vibrio cyclitrophicus]NOH19475.1 hypothetical protein [Vibrio cyclitrophicus]